jgi:hypothetical protein
MTTRFNSKAFLGGFALLVSATLLSTACGSDDLNNSPSDETPVLTGGTSSSGGKGGTSNGAGGEGDGDGGTNTGSGGKGGKGGSGATGGSGGTGGAPPAQECEPEFDHDGECWTCPQLQPEDTDLEYRDEQFRKQCTDSSCEPFDNADRIPNFDPEDPFPETLP